MSIALLMNQTIRMDIKGITDETLLDNHPIIRAVNAKVHIQEHNEIHYDTPNFKLGQNGMTLSLNHQGDTWIQRFGFKIKGKKEKQWVTSQVTEDQLDLQTVKRLFPNRPTQQISFKALAPVFTLHCREKQWSLTFPDGVHLLLSEEQGYLKFGATRHPFHELVLERKSGDLGRWFQIALEIAHLCSPSLSCANPITRGFAWLDPTFIVPTPQNSIELNSGMTVRQAFTPLVSGLLQHIQDQQCLLLHGGKEAQLTGAKQLSQSMGQLQTLLLLCHAYLPPEIRNEMDREIEWLQKELKPVLQMHTFLTETLEPLMTQFADYPGLESLLDQANKRLEKAIKRLANGLNSFRFTRFMLGMANWIFGRNWEHLLDLPQREGLVTPIDDFAKENLRHYQTQLLKRGKKFSKMSLSGRCGLQNTLDLMSHATLLFSELFAKKRVLSFQEALIRIQNSVHLLIDLQASGRLFNKLVDKNEADAVGHLIQGWQGARTNRRLIESETEWNQFSNASPFWE